MPHSASDRQVPALATKTTFPARPGPSLLPGFLSGARAMAYCIILVPPPQGRSPSAPNLQLLLRDLQQLAQLA